MHYVDSIGSYISQQEGNQLLQFSLGLSAVLVQYAAVFYGENSYSVTICKTKLGQRINVYIFRGKTHLDPFS